MHTIRLRGPWRIEPVKRFARQPDNSYAAVAHDLPPSAEAKLPADWGGVLGRDFLGIVRYTRNFNRPTGLDPRGRVWLVVEGPRSCGLVRVNDTVLGNARFGSEAARYDITALLKDHNAVVIDVGHPELDDDGRARDRERRLEPGGLVGEVRLEIEE